MKRTCDTPTDCRALRPWPLGRLRLVRQAAVEDIDRQRVAAVRTLQALGYKYRNGEWLSLSTVATPHSLLANADAMHGALMPRADALSSEVSELQAIADVLESYEAKRWPLGRDPSVPGGKG
jgi:hypothetical protein